MDDSCCVFPQVRRAMQTDVMSNEGHQAGSVGFRVCFGFNYVLFTSPISDLLHHGNCTKLWDCEDG